MIKKKKRNTLVYLANTKKKKKKTKKWVKDIQQKKKKHFQSCIVGPNHDFYKPPFFCLSPLTSHISTPIVAGVWWSGLS